KSRSGRVKPYCVFGGSQEPVGKRDSDCVCREGPRRAIVQEFRLTFFQSLRLEPANVRATMQMRRTSRIKLAVLASALLLPALVRAADSNLVSSSFEFKLPLGIPQDLWVYFIPQDNPMTAAKVDLGRKLFFEPRLSADGTVSCATCHDPKRAFTDG